MGVLEQYSGQPEFDAAYATRDCHELARICSPGRTKNVLVPIADVQAKLQESGAWWAIKAIAANDTNPANQAAIVVTDIPDARYVNLDMSLELIGQMFGALVQAGALAQSVVDDILAMGKVEYPYTQRSIAEELFNPDGTPK